MSVNVAVVQGKGITYALAKQAGLSDADMKKVGLSKWTQVMDLVNQNQQKVNSYNASNPNDKKESIFSGGNDTSRIADKTSWKTDFKVNAEQTMQIDSGIFNQIKAILTGQPAKTDVKPVEIKPLEQKPVSFDLPSHEELPEKLEVPPDVKKASDEAMIDKLGGKIIERKVNGEKQDIAVVKIDGKKVRREIKEDGTLGDTLVAVSTLGKNKYITQTEMDERINNVFPEGLPEGVTASFVNIGGTPTLVFKKDGKTLDQAQLRELAKSKNVLKKGEINQNNINTENTPNEVKQENSTPYNYDNDNMYKQMSETLQKLENEISQFEKQNNITKGDKFSEVNAMLADGYIDYSFNQHKYDAVKSDLDSYKDVMDKWKDGFKFPAYSMNRNINGRNVINVNYTNLECITLKNGQRAYKTDQGTFYPSHDGNPGNKPVPKELLNS